MRRRAGIATVVSLLVVTGLAGPARADRLSDARAEAARVADRIDALGDEAARLGEAYNGALLELADAEQAVRDAEADLATTETTLGRTRSAMSDFALRAYVLADQTVGVASLVAGGSLVDGAAQRSTYSQLALGGTLEEADQLKALGQDLTAKRAVLEQRRSQVEAEAAATDAARQAAENAEVKQEQVLGNLQGEIAQLVEQERLRREEEARQAAEQARRDAEAAAQAQAAREQAARDQAARDQAAQEQAAREQAAQEQAAREQAAQEQAAREQAARDQAAQQERASQGVTAAPATNAEHPTASTTTRAPATAAPIASSGGGDQRAGQGDPPSRAPDPPSIDIPEASAAAQVAVQAALSQLGVPYRFNTAIPGVNFDCSGLTMWAWAQAGVSMDHYSYSQARQFPRVPLDQLQPGDLVFPGGLGHVGIYLGNNRYVHAPRTGDVVKVSSMGGNIVLAVRPG